MTNLNPNTINYFSKIPKLNYRTPDISKIFLLGLKFLSEMSINIRQHLGCCAPSNSLRCVICKSIYTLIFY